MGCILTIRWFGDHRGSWFGVHRTKPCRAALFVFLWLHTFCVTGPSAADERPRWLDGQALQQRLHNPLQITWAGVPASAALQRLSETYGIAIWLDRRIDPSTPIQANGSYRSLASFLDQMAQEHGWSVRQIGPVVYVGPPSVPQAAFVHNQRQSDAVRSLPPAIRRRWESDRLVSWDALAQPREIVGQWLIDANLSNVDLRTIPHDLWPARSLPPMNLRECLVLCLAGFDLAPEIRPDGTLSIVPLPKDPGGRVPYTLTTIQQRRVATLTQQLPPGTWQLERGQLVVEGSADLHQLVQQWLRPKSTNSSPERRPPTASAQRFTLNVQQQRLSAVLQAIANQTQLTVQFDDNAQSFADRRISVSVRDATLAELLRNICEQAEVEYQLAPPTLKISVP